MSKPIQKCRDYDMAYLGRTGFDELWECTNCKAKNTLNSYFTEERTNDEILNKIHEGRQIFASKSEID